MRRLAPWASLVVLVFCAPALALDPTRNLREFGQQVWLAENGLPQNTVQSITQTRDGYIWIGTQDGLARFDGVRFTIFGRENTPQFKSNDIAFLYEDRQGALWIATSFGLIRRQNDRFTTFTASEGLPDNHIGPIIEDVGGNLWIATSAGLAMYRDGHFRTLTTSDGLLTNVIEDLTGAEDGSLLVLTSGGLQLLKDGKLLDWKAPTQIRNTNITALATEVGRLWLGTTEGLIEIENGNLTPDSSNESFKNVRINSLRVDREGALWIGTSGGLWRLRNGQLETLTTTDGLSSNLVLSVFEDREGNVWVGTEAGGIDLLKNRKFTTLTVKDGLASDLIKAVYQDHSGGMWLGTNGGGLNLIKNGKTSTFTTRDGLLSDVVLSISGDDAGNLWIGTPDGLNHLKDGKFTSYTFADGLSSDLIRSVYVDHGGNLWVGTRAGLDKFRDGTFTAFTTRDGLANDFIGALYQDAKGNLWIGTLGGLSKFADGHFTTFTTKDGLSSNTITCIYEDADGDLWIGTSGGGVNRMRGNTFVSFTSHNALPDDVVYRIIEDRQQRLWFSSNKGIFRIDKRELNAFADKQTDTFSSTLYGTADGMLTRECSGGGHPAAWKAADGRLWFATIRGIAIVDPDHLALNTTPPPLVIEQVRVDDQPLILDAAAKVAAGSSRFDFYYTAPSFVAPENVHFKYKLEGFDHDWIDGGNRRVAYYTNLRPGSYRFRVMAANNDGVWSEGDAAFDFYLQARFYQTYWFYALCVLTLGLAVWQLYRLRVRHMSSQFKAVLAERTRIAREIHDNLAQDILGISVQLELVARLMPRESEVVKQPLDRARILVRNSMTEARRYVWDLRSQALEEKDLPTALNEMARRLTAERESQAQVQVTGTFRSLSPSVEGNLLRIAQEAINNSIKHAHAQRILIGLHFDAESVQLSVQDDGRGFDPRQAYTDGHFGLLGMRERAEQVGGKFMLRSEPNAGTEVVVKVPLKN